MAPRIPHILMTAHGLMPGGDVWSCGLRSTAWTEPLDDAAGNQLALEVAGAWVTFRNTPGPAMLFNNYVDSESKATVDGVTVRSIDAAGVTSAQFERSSVNPEIKVNGGLDEFPNQCALAITLMTARAGRTGKGRVYVPCVGSVQLLNGRIPAATVGLIAVGAKTLVDNINLHLLGIAPDLFVGVQSAKTDAGGAFPAGYAGAKVTSIRVGDIVDTQRRRRSSLAESYQGQPIA